jgi:pilus assembly protein Flp/PilA
MLRFSSPHPGGQRGQGMVEYALIIALIAIALVVALTAFGGGLQKFYNTITNTVNAN